MNRRDMIVRSAAALGTLTLTSVVPDLANAITPIGPRTVTYKGLVINTDLYSNIMFENNLVTRVVVIRLVTKEGHKRIFEFSEEQLSWHRNWIQETINYNIDKIGT